jgi:hypothetical protein
MEALINGVETMFKTVVQILSKKRRIDNQPYILMDSPEEDDANQDSEH